MDKINEEIQKDLYRPITSGVKGWTKVFGYFFLGIILGIIVVKAFIG